MLKTIAIIFVVAVLAVLGYAATRPDTFRVERTASINAPRETVFAVINDFHRWESWSPYEKLDPAMKRAISGAPSGKGAVYEWEGNSKAGKGRMEILDTSPPSRITIKLDFDKPFEAHNVAEFVLEPRGNATNVTWAMQGPSPFMVKLMSVFLNMDHLVGRDFETGLANLKSLAETRA
jgi:uncharacterized protein YndB with AHSA1/START domain